jgi:predicted transcriptional regulator
MKSLEFLERHRKDKGLSWRKLAKATKVSEAYWFKLMEAITAYENPTKSKEIG